MRLPRASAAFQLSHPCTSQRKVMPIRRTTQAASQPNTRIWKCCRRVSSLGLDSAVRTRLVSTIASSGSRVMASSGDYEIGRLGLHKNLKPPTGLLPAACRLHSLVMRAAAAFRTHPGADLVRIGHVAGLTVHAIRRIQFQPLTGRAFFHLIHLGGAEILARIAVLFNAAVIADVEISDAEMRRLVLLMVGRRVVNVLQLVECQFAVGSHPLRPLAVKLR